MRLSIRVATWLLCSVFSASAYTVNAQGILIIHNPPRPIPLPRPIPVPQPPSLSYRIQELSVEAQVNDQAARVQITQTFINTSRQPMEVQFVFPLPPDSAVDRLTFLVDGREFAGKLLPADEARRIYESYVRRMQDPALLEWLGHGMFQTSVFPVPPGGKRQVILRYHQLLRRQDNLVQLLVPLATARYSSQALERLTIHVSLTASNPIKNLYSPNYTVNIQRPDALHAHIHYEAREIIPTTDFHLYYDMESGPVGASLISYRPKRDEDGYFVLLASPDLGKQTVEIARKTVILVLDRSGSMNGKKIEQAKEALRFIVSNLRPEDLFNIVVYDSEVEMFRPELQRYNETTRRAALSFVDGIYAGGSTNIDAALASALTLLRDSSGPQYILFLTDGLPTAGEVNELRIAANVRQRNQTGARLMTFGVGYDVNSRLLDRLVYENNGVSVYVKPDENLEQAISLFYDRFRSPILTDISVDVRLEHDATSTTPVINRVYPRRIGDLFAGEQLVIVGRYRQSGGAKVTIRGRIGDSEKQFEFPAQLVEESVDHRSSFAEKLWVLRRIGQIIDELDLHGKNDELIRELVELSTKHGILTPYTSFLAEEEGRRQLAELPALSGRASIALDQLQRAEGAEGFFQRRLKQEFKAASDLAGSQLGRLGAGGLGGYGGLPPRTTRPDPSSGQAGSPAAPATDPAAVTAGVRQVGTLAVYQRGDIWIAANARDIDPERDAHRIRKLTRFSNEYFELLQKTTAEERQLLAAQAPGEKLLARLQGVVYLIE